ncbi:MAG: Cof-type HAD-IIB family hydrolase [Tannerella sp.]|jgi:Cof subfamily protein (haloacid dehalogenase superfamily)|nr:Cof-type HAD-IIB family hydrolase [Tannerella sp.]
MKYKLLVLDVDDTLLNSDKKISKRTVLSLIKAQQMGLRIALASGRPSHGLLHFAKQLELDQHQGFIISFNGSQLMNMQTGQLLFEKHIHAAMIPHLERKAKKQSFAMFTYDYDTIITNNQNNRWIRQEAASNRMRIIPVSKLADTVNFSPHKCVLVSDDVEALATLESLWKRRLAGTLEVFRPVPHFLEIIPNYISKASTLSILLETLNIRNDQVIAIGDGVSDVAMIQMAGLGIAMGNAQESVKACADDVTESNDMEGVALAVEKYVLSVIQPNEIPLKHINEISQHALVGNLGIQFTYASENRVEATMPVDSRTRQPFGILHGGATLALAETVAGFGSMILCQPDETMVGMQVSGNHVSSAHEGDTVRAVATIIHKGQSSHVWDVNVYTSTDKLVSTIHVLNSVMKKK